MNLIPSLIKTHGHRANERLDSGRRLVIRGSESSSDSFIVEDRDFECEVLSHVFDDHHKEWKLDSECLFLVMGTCYVSSTHVGTRDLENAGLNVAVCKSLDVTVLNILVPNLKGFTPIYIFSLIFLSIFG